jgi:hypothetical protein
MRLTLVFTSLLLAFTGCQNVAAQNNTKEPYRPPMDIPLFLSGTFAELRSGHFHSGVDFRTQGVEGQKIYAIEDGYISRIAVSPGGFGKAAYINHPKTGHTSVYAHLQRFHGQVATYVKEQQYASERFAVNLHPEAGKFTVKKGELIGLTGNSGSSGGPHLHFEIRDAATQHPLNPLHFGFQVKDYIRPSITRLAVYPVSEDATIDGQSLYKVFEVQGWGEQHRLKDHAVIKASGEIAFGIGTHDTHNDTPNKNGVYAIDLHIDSILVFSFRADRFAFGETRYINSFIDYAHYVNHKQRIIRSEVDKMNRLGLYHGPKNKGSFTVITGKTHQGEYVVTDNHGNVSRLPFSILGVEAAEVAAKKETLKEAGQQISAGNAVKLKADTYSADFAANAFYRDLRLHHFAKADSSKLSDVVNLGDPGIPVHSYFDLGIRPYPTPIATDKLLIAYLEEGKEPSSIGGKWKNNQLVARARALGKYVVMADSTNPTIRPLNFKNGGDISALKQLRIEIKDDLSGIDSYHPKLNGQWILMEYDPKNNLLFYEIDERMQNGSNQFEIVVKDKCGNTSSYRAELRYLKE